LAQAEKLVHADDQPVLEFKAGKAIAIYEDQGATVAKSIAAKRVRRSRRIVKKVPETRNSSVSEKVDHLELASQIEDAQTKRDSEDSVLLSAKQHQPEDALPCLSEISSIGGKEHDPTRARVDDF
jgi:hypothetical protein